MTREEIIKEIHKNHCELEIIDNLNVWYREQFAMVKEQNKEYRATIKAVDKLNKNEAIKNLIEEMDII